jgi:hypothetical protein
VLLSFLVSSSSEYARLGLLFRGISPPSFGETGRDFIISGVATQRLGWGLVVVHKARQLLSKGYDAEERKVSLHFLLIELYSVLLSAREHVNTELACLLKEQVMYTGRGLCE